VRRYEKIRPVGEAGISSKSTDGENGDTSPYLTASYLNYVREVSLLSNFKGSKVATQSYDICFSMAEERI
jgi:hypothetical protein